MRIDLASKHFHRFFSLGLILALGIFIYLILLPGDPKNAWLLGLSRSRFILVAGALVLSGIMAGFLVATRRGVQWILDVANRFNEWLGNSTNFWTVIVLLAGFVLVGLIGISYAWGARNDLQATAYIARLGPFALWAFALLVYALVATWQSAAGTQFGRRAELLADTNFHDRLMILLILLFSMGKTLWGELISIGRGFGWDGGIYGDVAMDFYKEVVVNQLFEFNFQRILPSTIVHFSLRLLGVELDREAAILGFQVFNIVVLLLGLYVWGKVADVLKFNIRTRWLAFIGLYLNYAFLKQMFFYPVLTDALAFTLGVLALYFYLKDWRWAMWLLLVAAAFTWPLMVVGILILMAFPRQDTEDAPAPWRLNLWAAAALSLLWLSAVIYFHFIQGRHPDFGLAIYEPTVWLSIPLGLVFVFLLFYFALDNKNLFDFRSYFRQLKWSWLLLGVVTFLALRWVVTTFSQPGGLGYAWYFTRLSLDTINRPLIFLLAHIVYFGPFVLLTVFFFRRFAKQIHRFGLGMALFMLMHLVLTLDSETRHLVNVLPFFMAFTALAANGLRWPRWFYWGLAAVGILTSKTFIRFGTLSGSEFEFPRQWYFMNHGPWINNDMYVVQGVIILLVAAAVFWSIRKQRSLRNANS